MHHWEICNLPLQNSNCVKLKEILNAWAVALFWRFCVRYANRCPSAIHTDLLSVRSILVVKLDALGDFVLATPFLRELRRLAPHATITLITREIAGPLARNSPFIDRALVLNVDFQPRRWGSLKRVANYDRFFRNELPNHSFDLAIIPRTGPDIGYAQLAACLSGAKCRVGFASAASQTDNHSAPLTLTVKYPATHVHEAEANLLLLEALGASPCAGPLELNCSTSEITDLENALIKMGLNISSGFIALGVGASLPHKRWPAEYFYSVAQQLEGKIGMPIIILGDESDRLRFPTSKGLIFNLAGLLSPSQSWALLRMARLFIGNDSGAVHLASAAACPILLISWDRPEQNENDVNSFRRFHPYGVPYRVLHPQTEDGRREASSITIDRVLAVANSMLFAEAAAPVGFANKPSL